MGGVGTVVTIDINSRHHHLYYDFYSYSPLFILYYVYITDCTILCYLKCIFIFIVLFIVIVDVDIDYQH